MIVHLVVKIQDVQLKKSPLRFIVGSKLNLNEQYRAIHMTGLLLSTSAFFSV